MREDTTPDANAGARVRAAKSSWRAAGLAKARLLRAGFRHTVRRHILVPRSPSSGLLVLIGLMAVGGQLIARAPQDPEARFRASVDIVNVTATVSDGEGRFVPGLRMQDFVIHEDGTLQQVSFFSNERVPISLGILLDASGSMTSEKMLAARSAIDRFAFELLDAEDELFFGEFASQARITQTWTTDRSLISRAVRNVAPTGGTAMYDAIAQALPLAAQGKHRKKALLVISDGNDTSSRFSVDDLRRLIRQSEVLVYALGVDSQASGPTPFRLRPRQRPQLRLPIPPRPFPTPGGRRPQPGLPPPPVMGGPTWQRGSVERVNVAALREITDDSGGRTEIVRQYGDLGAATARLADELSKQYYLGYSSTQPRDGRWHAIRVDVRDGRDRDVTIRARRGYVAN